MVVGAGTVLTVEQARAAAEPGPRSPSLPGTDDEVVAACAGARAAVLPGHRHAVRARARPPARLHDGEGLPGLDARRARVPSRRLGDLPQARFLPTGGIDAGSLALVPRRARGDRLRRQLDRRPAGDPERDFDGIERRARAAIEAIG